jgi:hypothetical protein
MTERILGPTGGRRRRRFMLLPTLAVAVAALAALFVVSGATGGVITATDFELDGNAIAEPGGDIDDANNVCKSFSANPAQCTTAAPSIATAGSFDADKPDNAADGGIFTTGGSKDDLDVSSWRWTAGSVPDKDDIQNAFAARYADGMLYFGADRSAQNGDSQIGFWFFHNKVTQNADGTFSGVHQAPDATHTHGDILVLSDFTQGGGTPTIRIFEWVGVGNAAQPCATQTCDLNLIGGGPTPAVCTPTLSPDNFCAIVNNGTIPSPWTYQAKSGKVDPNTFPPGGYYEGGIDLNFLNLQNECFATFLAETRASQSVDATLKDFVLGGFGSCGATLATTASGAGPIGSNGQATISDSAKITVSGPTSPPAPTGFVDFYLCGPLTSATACTAATGTLKAHVNLNTATHQVGTNDYIVNSGGVTVTAAGTYCWFATWPGDSQYTTGPFSDANTTTECVVITPRQPALHTQVSNAGPVSPGTAVHDTVIFDTAPATPSNGVFGTITFRLYSSNTCSAASLVTSSTATVQAGVTSYDSANASPTTPGTYYWTAQYTPGTGDANNLPIAETACGAANEQFVVQQFQPALTTAQTWTVKDSATVTASGGGALAGSVTFELYTAAGCPAANLVAGSHEVVPVTDTGTLGTETVSSTPITIIVDRPTLYWKVSYSSTNPSHADIPATCTENSSLDINN